jgi:hypothetical protein
VTQARIQHFLLIYDHEQGKLIHTEPFGEDQDSALAAYARAEMDYRERPRIEIVLVGSDSLETVRLTHANYFEETVTSPYLIRL